mmetsp:Transcript_10982/g.38110  ORF Transcript_10982/g.38110 Transcript_10982/m.38110 type:complete len:95 (+) Transcript_10982:3828-4112(+)
MYGIAEIPVCSQTHRSLCYCSSTKLRFLLSYSALLSGKMQNSEACWEVLCSVLVVVKSISREPFFQVRVLAEDVVALPDSNVSLSLYTSNHVYQ